MTLILNTGTICWSNTTYDTGQHKIVTLILNTGTICWTNTTLLDKVTAQLFVSHTLYSFYQ